MMKTILSTDKVVNLVFFGHISGFNSIPQVLDYGHKNIKEIIPCYVKNGQYFNLRTGQPVQKSGNVQEWPVLTGAVLKYEGEKNMFLLSRRIGGNRPLMLIEIMPSEFHKESMHMILVRKKMKKTTN